MKRTVLRLSLIALACATTGCNWLVPFIFIGEHKRSVPAEFDKLAGKRTVVLVWAEPATMFDYPHVRLELATYATEKIAANVENCDTVDAMDVEDYIVRNMEAMIDPMAVGRHFGADYVVYLELLRFQIRDPSTPDLAQGNIKASVSVYDINADSDQASRFILAPVEVIYPKSGPTLMSSSNAILIRQQSYDLFSGEVAQKFYEHKVDL